MNTNKSKTELDNLSWLLGSWSNITPEGRFYESWSKVNDSLFSGQSFMIVDEDTVFSEKINLSLTKDGLYYIPIVSNQNENKPVSFKLIAGSGKWIFENKEHDFPQRIIYSNPAQDSLFAWIEGEQNGKARREEFSFQRNH